MQRIFNKNKQADERVHELLAAIVFKYVTYQRLRRLHIKEGKDSRLAATPENEVSVRLSLRRGEIGLNNYVDGVLFSSKSQPEALFAKDTIDADSWRGYSADGVIPTPYGIELAHSHPITSKYYRRLIVATYLKPINARIFRNNLSEVRKSLFDEFVAIPKFDIHSVDYLAFCEVNFVTDSTVEGTIKRGTRREDNYITVEGLIDELEATSNRGLVIGLQDNGLVRILSQGGQVFSVRQENIFGVTDRFDVVSKKRTNELYISCVIDETSLSLAVVFDGSLDFSDMPTMTWKGYQDFNNASRFTSYVQRWLAERAKMDG